MSLGGNRRPQVLHWSDRGSNKRSIIASCLLNQKKKSFRIFRQKVLIWIKMQTNSCISHYAKSQIFVQKFNFDFPIKLSIFWGWKTRENVVVLDFLAVDNFDFTRKIVKKVWGEKLVKMLGFCQNWIFGQKFDSSHSVKCSCLFAF